MRSIAMVLVVFCAQALAAQSLGDVAREQREDTSRPKAHRVITNADLSSAEVAAPAKVEAAAPTSQPKTASTATSQPKTVAKPVNTATADPQRAQQQRVLVELNTRVQTLQGELSDLERERNAVKANSRYGDPNRAQTNEELGVMSGTIDRKQQELAAARAELAEAVERFNRASVIK
jgi:hypothetical protein